jgi:hypothetical protein
MLGRMCEQHRELARPSARLLRPRAVIAHTQQVRPPGERPILDQGREDGSITPVYEPVRNAVANS